MLKHFLKYLNGLFSVEKSQVFRIAIEMPLAFLHITKFINQI